ncbi:RNA-binding protein 27, partial [Mortierella polycephala]
MHLEGTAQEALKAYLTKELTLISDADPAMLADYIIALLKHDKSDSELKTLCISQLEDFLQKETEPFVQTMFKALDSKSYLQSEVAPTESTAAYEGDEETIPTGPAAERHLRHHQTPQQDHNRDQRQENSSSSRDRQKHLRGDSDGSEDEDRSYKHSRREVDRDHSAVSIDSRRRRDYSPSRPTDEERHGGSSSTNRIYGGRANDHSGPNGHIDNDRRGDRLGRALREQGLTTAGYNSRNNINSNNTGDRGQWNGPQQSNRSNFQDRQGQDGSWRGGASMRGGRGGMQGGHGFGQDRQRRQRCRDYDEQGYCMRGDMCPYDHGEDRIVVDDMPRVPFEMMGGMPGMMPNGPMGMGANRPPFFPGGPNGGIMPNAGELYDPEAAALPMDDMGSQRPAQGGHESGRFNQDMSSRGGMRGRGSLRGMRGGRGRGGASHPYAGPGRFGAGGSGGGGGAGSKTSLVVEHIPDEYNTIDRVNEFFKQFGSLTNIQVDQPAHKALIQYSTREEASAAYNSPEVIFGNRFVKVYWQPDDVDSATFGRQPKPTGQVRPEMPAAGHHHGSHAGSPKPPATSVLMTPERAAELAAERTAAAAKLQENMKTMQEIQQKKAELIRRQQEEQKKMIEKLMANKNMSQQDKDEILKGLKNVAIEITKEPVDHMAQARAAAVAAEAQKQAELQKEAEKMEKARLDRELETLNTNPADAESTTATTTAGSSDAETTAALKAKLAQLQAQ